MNLLTTPLHKQFAVVGALCALLAIPVQAQIQASFFDTFVPGTFGDAGSFVTNYTVTTTDLGTFSAAGNSKLVLAISTKTDSDPGGAATSITYNGAGMTLANDGVNTAQQTYQRTQQSIWYLDNVASDGDLVLNFDAATEGFALRLFALDNTETGVQLVADRKVAGDGVAPTLAPTASQSFLLYDVSRNAFGTSHTNLSDFDSNEFAFGGRGDSMGLWDIVGAGTYSPNVSGDNSNGGWVGAGFTIVPEPNTFFLVGGLGLALLLRRRR